MIIYIDKSSRRPTYTCSSISAIQRVLRVLFILCSCRTTYSCSAFCTTTTKGCCAAIISSFTSRTHRASFINSSSSIRSSSSSSSNNTSGTTTKKKKNSTDVRATGATTTKPTGERHKNFNSCNDDTESYFDTLAGNVVNCLIKSDLKRKGGGDGGGSTGWTSWVDDPSAYRLKSCIDLLSVVAAADNDDDDDDLILGWIRWLKASPAPLIIEMSTELRHAANQFIHDDQLKYIESSRQELLQRMGLRIFTLPSGKALNDTLRTPPGAMAFGKLLWGGVKRYRILPGKYQRKTGEREAIQGNSHNYHNNNQHDNHDNTNIPCWLQYGGPERTYEGLDMGPCALVEVYILPKGLSLPHALHDDAQLDSHMTLSQLSWNPKQMFQFYHNNNNNNNSNNNKGTDRTSTNDNNNSNNDLATLTGLMRNELLENTFTTSIGGLQPQISAIIRRVLDGRVFHAFDEDGNGQGNDKVIGNNQSLLDAKELESLGLNPVRGLLLYGPPGCGKTALAREIARVLRARKPKIVSAPELLDRWVGGSEKLVRSLFIEAEEELRKCGGDATKSSLHVIVIDEIDAVFRKRSASEDSASTTRASAVNQILAKLDGVEVLSNVLLLGMTNRRDLLDEALLRPGRLEVQIEIPLPTTEGRRQILQIHFQPLRRKGMLSDPLCKAIDGRMYVSNTSISSNQKSVRTSVKQAILGSQSRLGNIDLASDKFTKGFSGADLQGLVRCSGSIALARARQQGMGVDGLLITLDDVMTALAEVKQ